MEGSTVTTTLPNVNITTCGSNYTSHNQQVMTTASSATAAATSDSSDTRRSMRSSSGVIVHSTYMKVKSSPPKPNAHIPDTPATPAKTSSPAEQSSPKVEKNGRNRTKIENESLTCKNMLNSKKHEYHP